VNASFSVASGFTYAQAPPPATYSAVFPIWGCGGGATTGSASVSYSTTSAIITATAPMQAGISQFYVLGSAYLLDNSNSQYNGWYNNPSATMTITVPGYGKTPTPPCPCGCGKGGSITSPTSGDPVNLASGEAIIGGEDSAPDISVYNPTGPSVTFTREFYDGAVVSGTKTPGLPSGWFHNYGLTVTAVSSGSWAPLYLTYRNSALELLTPVLNSNGVPTGAFTVPSGCGYIVTGVASGTTGVWQSISITRQDHGTQTFTPVNANYSLTQISDRMGNSIVLHWDSASRLTSIAQNGGQTLLTLSYDPTSGLLTKIVDLYARQVSYSYGTSGGVSNCLLTASQLVPSGTNNPPARWTYSYAGGLLASLATPNPSGVGLSTTSFQHYYGMVIKQTDPNGNAWSYTYNSGSTVETRTDAHTHQLTTLTHQMDAFGQETATIDAGGNTTSYSYGDANNPWQRTQTSAPGGMTEIHTFDAQGNPATTTDARNVTTTLTYSYPSSFPLGERTTIQQGSNTPVTYTY
jgi:YD repeat-containing protein